MDEQMNRQAGVDSISLDVSVRPVQSEKNLLAFASVTINDCFKVHGFKVVNSEKGMFVDMPSAPDGKGGFRDACFPVNKEFREKLVTAILDGYDNAIQKMQSVVQAAEGTHRAPPKQRIDDQLRENKQAVQAHSRPPAQQHVAAKRADTSL